MLVVYCIRHESNEILSFNLTQTIFILKRHIYTSLSYKSLAMCDGLTLLIYFSFYNFLFYGYLVFFSVLPMISSV